MCGFGRPALRPVAIAPQRSKTEPSCPENETTGFLRLPRRVRRE